MTEILRVENLNKTFTKKSFLQPKSDITAAGHGIETGDNFLLINTSEVSESQVNQIGNRIKEILSK